MPQPRLESTGATVWRGLDWLGIMCRLGHNVISSPEVVVRTSVQQAIGGYRPELPHTGDAEMWMRFAVHSDVAYVKGADQAFYRIHAGQMTNDRVAYLDLVQRKAAYDMLFEEHAGRIPKAARLRRHAGRRMAKEALWRACRAYDRRRMDATPIPELVDFARGAYPRLRACPSTGACAGARRWASGVPLPPASHALRRAPPRAQRALVAAVGASGRVMSRLIRISAVSSPDASPVGPM